MGFVFISYSRQDTATVDAIVSRLESDGFEVWIDRANIKGGDLWTVAIVEAIDTAESFVLMLSPNSTASDNVRKEVQLAQDAKQKLFPLLIAAVKLPPQFRYQLAGIQLIDFATDPEAKYRELVEVLQANRETTLRDQPSPTRQVEVVITTADIPSFGHARREHLLATLARIAEAGRSKFTLANLTAGSVHAFIEMPTHAAYVLKTAALNRDKRLLNEGIQALRLNGEENFVLVRAGEIGPLHLTRQRPAFYKSFLPILLGFAIIAAILLAIFPTVKTFLQPPTPTRTPTATPTVTRTLTPTSTSTETLTPTQRPTLTATATVTPIPNRPPPPPQVSVDSMQPNGNVPCYLPGTLFWSTSDPDGISSYQVIIAIFNKATGGWDKVLNSSVSDSRLDISDIVAKYCGELMQVQVSAQDTLGAWSPWSSPLEFILEYPPPG